MSGLVAAIKLAFAAGQLEPVRVTELDQVPSGYDAITPASTTKVMYSDTVGAHVTGLRLGARDDGSSNPMRIFLHYNAMEEAAGLAATVFCKASERLDSRPVLGVSGAVQAEANFHNL